MQIEINHLQDFFDLVQPAFSRLQTNSSEAAPTLDVVFKPGDYCGISLSLESDLDEREIHVILRGSDPTHPSVLSDLSLKLSGITVRLENLVFRDNSRSPAILDVRATEQITLRNCAFIENSSLSPPGGELVKLSAGGLATTAELSNCWFIRNQMRGDNPLLSYETPYQFCFAKSCIDNLAFLDNDACFSIVPYQTRVFNIHNCVQYPSAITGESSVFVAINSDNTVLVIDHSLLVGASIEEIVTRWSATTTSVDEFKPLHFKQSTLLVNHPPAVDAVPKNTVLNETIIQPALMLKPTKAISKFTDKCIRLAKTGHAPDFKQLKKALVSSR